MCSSITRLSTAVTNLANLRQEMEVLTNLPTDLKALQEDVTNLMRGQRTQVISQGDSAEVAGRLDCVDAKLLDLSKVVAQLQAEMQQSDLQTALEELRMNTRMTRASLQESAEKVTQFHAAINKGVMVDVMKVLLTKAEKNQLEDMNRTVQQNLLDILKKLSSKVETTELADMGRLEKQAISEKLVKIDASCDRLQDLCKTLSNEIHVCKTVLERKLDTVIKDLTSHVGWSRTSFRPLFPMIPTLKWLQDSTKDVVDYLARNHTAVETIGTTVDQMSETANLTRQSVTNLGEVLESQEQRVARVESLSMGTLDTVNEQGEVIANIQKERPVIMNQILERLPKLPLRKPPATEATASTQQPPPADPQPPQPQPMGKPTDVPCSTAVGL